MPQLVLFHRSWGIGSDDFVFPGAVDGIVRCVWLLIVIIMYSLYAKDPDDTCIDSVYLHVYFVGLIIFLLVTACLEFAIAYASKQGTIADSSGRKHLPYLLYIRFVVGLLEVTWNAYGTWVAFEASKHCRDGVVNLAKGTVIAGWVVLFIAVLTCLVVFNLYPATNKPRARTRQFKRASRRTFSQTKRWEKRCRCLFLCARNDTESTGVFTTLAELCADYFKGTDLVPSDVIAGLILLSRKQERERHQFRVYVDRASSRRPNEDFVDAADVSNEHVTRPTSWMTLDLMSHYLKYALGSYGWPFYLTLTKGMCGLCSLCMACRCCSCFRKERPVYSDNCCQCNTAAFVNTTGLDEDDIVHVSLHNEIYEIPFYVVIDKTQNAVVIAIRGTLSLEDVITDLNVDRGDLNIPGIPEAKAHNGILSSANYLRRTLIDQDIIKKALSRLPGASLVVTGHSLGAGAAALLAILLKPEYPEVRCYAFSPPGELVSPEVSQYAEDVVCTVVLGDDIISRQGMLMMVDLKMQILKVIQETRLPKYKILSSGCSRMCCGRSATLDENVYGHDDVFDGPTSADANAVANGKMSQRSSLQISIEECEKHRKEKIQRNYSALLLPGKILHIEQSNVSGDENFVAHWKQKEEFTEIIVSSEMFSHHFPDSLLDAIDQLRDRKYTPVHASDKLDLPDVRLTVLSE
ncbi:diacylglycerol lipase-beta-like isoform X2 [Dreissena polymorpha]|nr:diacylglycerol lipase-beta-like isoform X2 [Dreissena polymorpha]